MTGVPPFLLGFRGRFIAYAIAGVGLILDGPRLEGGFVAFLSSPAGVAFVGGIVAIVGLSVEESGTLARIRFGIAARVLAPVFIVIAVALAVSEHHTPGVVFVLGTILVAAGFVHDVAVLRDLRHGQRVWLEAIRDGQLVVSIAGATVLIPLDVIAGAQVAVGDAGRGVFLHVTSRARIQGDVDNLPWVSASLAHDTLVLSEHQCNMDARAVVSRVRDAAVVRTYR